MDKQAATAEKHYLQVRKAFEVGDYEAALKGIMRVIQLNPEEPRYYFMRGDIFLEVGNLDAAVGDFNEVLERDPENLKAYLKRGEAHLLLDEPAAAVEDYTAVLKKSPLHVESYNQRGAASFALGSYTQALHDFKKARELAPNDSLPVIGLAVTYHAQGQFDAAEELWRLLMTIDEGYGDTEQVTMFLSALQPMLVDEACKLVERINA
jgi:tetratricopeptide (TPR) repeat protein